MTVLAERYRLETELGRGGMGQVWRATDLTLDRPVAVKLVPAVFADDSMLARFKREARVAARLSGHPHIVSVYDYGHHREELVDAAYIVMELVHGRPLSDLVAVGPLDVDKALTWSEHIARALEAAHADGIVHRDIKPANAVLVEKAGRPGAVKVLDFGISSLGGETSGLTATGIIMGTPAYIAPEVWNGERATAATDLYALGTVLFELLTGRSPFRCDNHYAYREAHLSFVPERADSLVPGLSPEVADLVEGLLAKNPAQRPATATQVIRTLQALRDALSASFAARDTVTASPLASTPGVVLPVHLRPTEPALPDTSPDGSNYSRGAEGTAQIWRDQTAPAAEAGDVNAMVVLGDQMKEQGDIDRARAWYTRAAEAGNADAMYALGRFLYDESDTNGAHTWFTRAVEAGSTNAMAGLGVLLSEQGDTEGARTWFARAAEAGSPRGMTNLGTLLFHDDDIDGARHWLTCAAEAGETDAMYNLAFLLQDRGETDEARVWYTRAAEAGNTDAMVGLGSLLREEDPEGARTWYTRAAEAGNTDAMTILGGLLYLDGNTDQGRSWWIRAAEVGEPGAMVGLGTLLREEDPEGARTWYTRAAEAGNVLAMNVLANALHAAGNTDDAHSWWTRAAEAGDSSAMIRLGAILHDEDPEGARRWYTRAIEAGENDAMYNLGVLSNERGETEEARVWYTRAAEAGNADAMNNLAILLHEQGSEKSAIKWWSQAADRGNVNAMAVIGFMLHRDGDIDGARSTWIRSAEGGNTKAMSELGELLYNEGDIEGARSWWIRADDERAAELVEGGEGQTGDPNRAASQQKNGETI
ncbi:serine/threonine-protein kinase [Streptomyces sp. SM1]|uniref:serine/threonine-protein kinase n=1 Tax=Streptomyces sp. SM1 TaxID=402229 RepID=UPI0011B00E5C|nr:serine/threonine-protein kinase [Streptomyces sp. SM1]